MPEKMKIYCAHCGRQLVNYEVNDDHCISKRGAIRLVANSYCCRDCNEYDENGLLPEEGGTNYRVF